MDASSIVPTAHGRVVYTQGMGTPKRKEVIVHKRKASGDAPTNRYGLKAGWDRQRKQQVLDGGSNTRMLLKASIDKTIVTKLPVTGQVNALLQTETDLEAGDLIYVRMDVPRQNTVDIYCHAQSARVAGVGESPF